MSVGSVTTTTDILPVALDKVAEVEARSRNYPTLVQKREELQKTHDEALARAEEEYQVALYPLWLKRHEAINKAEEDLLQGKAFVEAAYNDTVALEKAALLKDKVLKARFKKVGV